jgi:hypothetical protein
VSPARASLAALLWACASRGVVPQDTAPDVDTGEPPAAFPAGSLLLAEGFDDADFASRGWYDGATGEISAEAFSGAGALRCTFAEGARSCRGGKPARHPLPETETLYLSFRVRYEDGWVGSGRPYHPHEWQAVTNADPDFVGPASTHLTVYVEHVARQPRVGMQDSLNVDPRCILRNDDSFVGCDGDFEAFEFTEARSAASCNGLVGDYDTRDCFDSGGWYSAKGWKSTAELTNGEWHHVEAYFALNTIAGGVGRADGVVRYALDGQVLVATDEALLRTGALPDLRFDQLLLLPYIGDGSPIEQTVLYDALVVGTGKP